MALTALTRLGLRRVSTGLRVMSGRRTDAVDAASVPACAGEDEELTGYA